MASNSIVSSSSRSASSASQGAVGRTEASTTEPTSGAAAMQLGDAIDDLQHVVGVVRPVVVIDDDARHRPAPVVEREADRGRLIEIGGVEDHLDRTVGGSQRCGEGAGWRVARVAGR